MDKGKQIVMTNNGSCGGSNISDNWKNNESLIDRSKVKILLWESNPESCEEDSTLLSQCGYQVIPVLSAVEMNGVLHVEGPNIDILIFEVSLITGIGMRMLNYIMHDKDLQHIAVIMLSTQDGLSLIHKGLQHGATDFLVKPLCTNELLSLWTHMRRSRCVGSFTGSTPNTTP